MSDELFFSRREMLRRGASLLSAAATVPLFLDRTALALSGPSDSPGPKRKTRNDASRILVVVQLAGGNDGLNTVVPIGNDRYYQSRPSLAIRKDDALSINADLAFPKSAEGLKSLYDDGLLAVVQGVGYPNPNRSHFVSTDIWSTADPEERIHNGWLGRYFDCECKGSARPDPKSGIALTQESPLAMQGARFSPVSFNSPEELSWRGPAAHGRGMAAFNKLNQSKRKNTRKTEAPLDQAGALAYLERMAMDARASAEEIQRATGIDGANSRNQGFRFRFQNRGRGGELGQKLEMVKRMIAAGLDARVYYVSMGGFDTHAQQAGRHQTLITQLGEALKDFTLSLKADGLLDRVTIMTFSEFGRRVAENGSQGTDHGAAAPLFIVGSSVRPGLHGEHPSLEPADLDAGDLKWQVDFRSIYTAVLSDWLKADAAKVLGGEYSKAALFRV
ncbi:MAG: DUF1501 domain-containing protein [Phycisphaerae bacterium]|nr:DUF1501 domain-containing protein [Phycisphaerae bacterium]